MKPAHINPIGIRALIGNLAVSVSLLPVGIFALFRWETGGPAFWTASAVFVAGSLAFYCIRRHGRGRFGIVRAAEYPSGATDDNT